MALHAGTRGPGHVSRAASGAVPAEGGTSASRYSVAGTRYRFPIETSTIVDSGAASLVRQVTQWAFGSPAYPTTDPRFFIANFWQMSSGAEVGCAVDIVIDKLALKVNGAWVNLTTGLPLTVSSSSRGEWTSPMAGVTIPPNANIVARMAWHLNTLSGNSVVPMHGAFRNTTFNGAGLSDDHQADTEANAATILALVPNDGVTTQTNLSKNAGSVFMIPSMMVAKGGDGRPAILIIGDSIGYGENQTSVPGSYTGRGEWGYVPVGLDSNVASKRLAYCNLSVPGQGVNPGAPGWQNRNRWEKKANAVKDIRDAHGAWPMDRVLCEMGENSVNEAGGLIALMEPFHDLLTAEWGLPITQAQLLPKSSSTDSWATLANQTVAAVDTYPSGARWLFNAACDPGGSLRTSGRIADTIRTWEKSAYDLGANRHKFATRPFSTTLAAAYTANANSASLTHSPPVGTGFLINSAGGLCQVTSVSGVGLYVVNIVRTAGVPAAVSGAVVQETPHDNGALHPTPIVHRDVYSAAVVDWKIAQGWV